MLRYILTLMTLSFLSFANVNLTTTHDTNIKGANIHGSESTTLNVGGDLNVASVQDKSSNSSRSNGASVGVSDGGANVGVNSSSSENSTQNVILSSITGAEVTVNVKGDHCTV